jgi:hypothetical protein
MSSSSVDVGISDSSSLVAVLTAFASSLFLISLPIRVYVKGRTNRYGLDDAFYFCAVVSVITYIL